MAILVTLTWTRGPVAAQETGPAMQVTVGFDGYCPSGGWCPVYAVLSNEGVDVEGELRIAVRVTSGSTEPDVYVRQVVLPANARKAYFLYIPSTGFGLSSRSHLVVQFRAGDGQDELFSSQRVAVEWLDEGDRLYGVASSNPSALNFLSNVAPGGGAAAVAHLDLDALPPDPLAWEGLDVLILNDVDTTVLSGEQRRALKTWLAHGGHLVVGGGAGAARTVAGVSDLLPVVLGGIRPVDSLWALGERLSVPVAEGPYAVAQATLRDGEVLIQQAPYAVEGGVTGDPEQEQGDEQGALLLLARRRYGAGTATSTRGGKVDFLAFDAGLNPFTQWDDNTRLWEFIIGAGDAGTRRLSVRSGNGAHEAINAIPGLELPSTLQILAFMLVYTLLIGPVNYVVLRKLDKRELAWLTIPVLVVGFTACAYVTGFQIRGSRAIVHQLAAVYVPEGFLSTLGGTGEVVGRVSQVVGLFSPQRTTYDVWVTGAGVRQIPDDYYGGPSRQPLRIIEEAEGLTVTNLRVDVGGIRPFLAEGYVDVPGVEADLRLTVDTAGALQLEGTVHNGDLSLKGAVLVVGDDEQRLGDLEAGEEVGVRLSLHGGAGAMSSGPWSSVSPYGHNIPEQILGPGNYWEDRELYRRYQFLQAFFPYEGPGLAPGVYLIGWREGKVPLPVEVVDRPFSTVEMTLYVYDLPVAGLETGATITIPPGFIISQVEETTGYVDVWSDGFHDFRMEMEAGAEVVLRFTVWPGVTVSRVDELVLDMQGSSQGSISHSPTVSLWSQERGDWERLDIGWGQHTIPNGGAYITPPGDLLLRLKTGAEWSAEVESLAITIKGRR